MKLIKRVQQVITLSLIMVVVGCVTVLGAELQEPNALFNSNLVVNQPAQPNLPGTMTVDLIIFIGQSNMAGEGGSKVAAPAVPNGHGYEFRAISDPSGLHNIEEPFGATEKAWLGSQASADHGTMVSSFVNAYYERTGVPIVAVSAERGASTTEFYLRPEVNAELVSRFEAASTYLASNYITVRHKYAVYFQGESDSLEGISGETHKQNLVKIFQPLFAKGLQQVFVINPGQRKSSGAYNEINTAQSQLCESNPQFTLASNLLNTIDSAYLVDDLHYNQMALNLVGTDAGLRVAAVAGR